MSVLDVRGLRIDAPQGVIVDGLDLTVGEGETIGIVGESGSGKSLTARALVGGQRIEKRSKAGRANPLNDRRSVR